MICLQHSSLPPIPTAPSAQLSFALPPFMPPDTTSRAERSLLSVLEREQAGRVRARTLSPQPSTPTSPAAPIRALRAAAELDLEVDLVTLVERSIALQSSPPRKRGQNRPPIGPRPYFVTSPSSQPSDPAHQPPPFTLSSGDPSPVIATPVATPAILTVHRRKGRRATLPDWMERPDVDALTRPIPPVPPLPQTTPAPPPQSQTQISQTPALSQRASPSSSPPPQRRPKAGAPPRASASALAAATRPSPQPQPQSQPQAQSGAASAASSMRRSSRERSPEPPYVALAVRPNIDRTETAPAVLLRSAQLASSSRSQTSSRSSQLASSWPAAPVLTPTSTEEGLRFDAERANRRLRATAGRVCFDDVALPPPELEEDEDSDGSRAKRPRTGRRWSLW